MLLLLALIIIISLISLYVVVITNKQYNRTALPVPIVYYSHCYSDNWFI